MDVAGDALADPDRYDAADPAKGGRGHNLVVDGGIMAHTGQPDVVVVMTGAA